MTQMLDTSGQPTAVPAAKVVAATGGAAVGSSIVVILSWLVTSLTGVVVPIEVQSAFAVVLAALGAFSVGYFVPPGATERIGEPAPTN